MRNRLLRAIAIAGVGALLWAVPATAASSCEDLASLKIANGKITAATPVAAGAFTQPGPGGILAGGPGGVSVFKSAPAFCRVTATLTPSADSDIKIEVWMPVENWNGKLVGVGNGVWAGNISYSALAEPLARGYAAVATDTGHVGMGLDVKFAVGHPERLIDFGYRAVHEMTVNAKIFIDAYYGRKAQRSLWASCSTGGRQGLMAGYRYPDDYDGISSMAPANPMTRLMIGSLWSGYAAMRDVARQTPAPRLTAVTRAYVNHCDEKDGLKDGIVADPEHCDFDPGMLLCKDGGGDCLTAAQVEALRDVYKGAVNPRTGELVFSGFTPGSEQQLTALIGGKEPFPAATSYFRDLVFADPRWDYKSYDYDKDLAASLKAGDVIDVPGDGLKKFVEKGGKLLLSHGWADGLIPAENTVAFYKTMMSKLDRKQSESVRLFMVPGMGHCGGGDASVTDMLSVLDQWVETGKAPERVIATGPNPQKPLSRPLCPYPTVAKYRGSGDVNDASSFECK